MTDLAEKQGVCGTCTIQLVRLAYRRAPWFCLVREPLRLGMVLMGKWHRIDPRQYRVYTQGCYGCVRFTKTALKEESASFRWLNERANPVFDRILETIVTKEEVSEAKRFAHQSTQLAGEDAVAKAGDHLRPAQGEPFELHDGILRRLADEK